jgi:hypothetical protein
LKQLCHVVVALEEGNIIKIIIIIKYKEIIIISFINRNPSDDFFKALITKDKLHSLWNQWFNNVNRHMFDHENPYWEIEFQDLTAKIMKIHYEFKYFGGTRGNGERREIRKVLKYFDPLTRDFHVRTNTGLNICESISIYRGLYDIPANDLTHPYHLIT